MPVASTRNPPTTLNLLAVPLGNRQLISCLPFLATGNVPARNIWKISAPRHEGGDPVPLDDRVTEPPTLSQLGISKNTASFAQKLAGMSDEKVQAVENRQQSVSQALREQQKERVRQDVRLPSEKYRVVYAGAPWSFGNTGLDDRGIISELTKSRSVRTMFPALRVGIFPGNWTPANLCHSGRFSLLT